MTLTTTNNRKDYTGNGATTVFAYDFLIVANADLGVYLDGVKKTLTTDYTVSGAGVPTGGNVTFVIAPGNGVAVSIVREVAYTQGVAYVENQKFPATTHEGALDRLTMLCQQLLEKIGRAATFKIQSLLANPIMADGVVGKSLRWKTTTELENIDLVSLGALGLPLTIPQGGTNAISAAAARLNLLGKPTTAPSSTYTLVAGDMGGIWLPFSRTVDQVFTLPAAAVAGAGAKIQFLNVSGDLAGGGATPGKLMTVNTVGGELILQRSGLTSTSFVIPSGVYRRADIVELLSVSGEAGYSWVLTSGSPEYLGMPGQRDGAVRIFVGPEASTVHIYPHDGNGITLYDTTTKQWRPYSISNAGLSALITNCTIDGVDGQTLVNDVNYYIYLYLRTGAPAIEFSSAVEVKESITGWQIKTGDQTRRLVGAVRNVSSGGVGLGLGAQNNNMGSYYDPLRVMPSFTLTSGSTASATWVAMTTPAQRLTLWTWGDGREPLILIVGTVFSNTAGVAMQIGVSVDGANPTKWVSIGNAVNYMSNVCALFAHNANGEGLHTYDIAFRSNGTAVMAIQDSLQIAAIYVG